MIELLVVVAIMAILLGLAIPAFQGANRGGRVRTAIFQLNSHLNLARQMAITTRQDVSVLFPGSLIADYDDNTISLAYASYAVYGKRDGYIGEWRRLPPGVVFHDTFIPPGDTKPAERFNVFLQGPDYRKSVPFPKIGDGIGTMLGLTFRYDGALDEAGFNRKSVFITEGWIEYDPNYDSIEPKFKPNTKIFGIEIRPESGQTRAREY